MNLDEAKKTIRSLLDLANDDAAAGLEVDNALHFARRLMLRHNLTEDDCPIEEARGAHEIAADVEYGEVSGYSAGANLSSWECSLLWAVSDLVGTVQWYRVARVTRRTPHGTIEFGSKGRPKTASEITFYGPAADAADALELLDTWTATIMAMARLKHGGCFRGSGRSYAEGFAQALRAKVSRMLRLEHHQAQAALDTPAEAGTTALALVRSHEIMRAKKDAGSKWLESKGVRLGTFSSRRGSALDHDAYRDGQADGHRSDFSRKRARAIGQ